MLYLILSQVNNWKGLGFVILAVALLLIFGFDKIVKLIIYLSDKIKEHNNKSKS